MKLYVTIETSKQTYSDLRYNSIYNKESEFELALAQQFLSAFRNEVLSTGGEERSVVVRITASRRPT